MAARQTGVARSRRRQAGTGHMSDETKYDYFGLSEGD
jgi:hypothetical protein